MGRIGVFFLFWRSLLFSGGGWNDLARFVPTFRPAGAGLAAFFCPEPDPPELLLEPRFKAEFKSKMVNFHREHICFLSRSTEFLV